MLLHAARSAGAISGSSWSTAAAGSVPTACSSRQVSHAEYRLPLQTPVVVMPLALRSSSNDTCIGWWMSPTQSPRNLSASWPAGIAAANDKPADIQLDRGAWPHSVVAKRRPSS